MDKCRAWARMRVHGFCLGLCSLGYKSLVGKRPHDARSPDAIQKSYAPRPEQAPEKRGTLCFNIRPERPHAICFGRSGEFNSLLRVCSTDALKKYYAACPGRAPEKCRTFCFKPPHLPERPQAICFGRSGEFNSLLKLPVPHCPSAAVAQAPGSIGRAISHQTRQIARQRRSSRPPLGLCWLGLAGLAWLRQRFPCILCSVGWPGRSVWVPCVLRSVGWPALTGRFSRILRSVNWPRWFSCILRSVGWPGQTGWFSCILCSPGWPGLVGRFPLHSPVGRLAWFGWAAFLHSLLGRLAWLGALAFVCPYPSFLLLFPFSSCLPHAPVSAFSQAILRIFLCACNSTPSSTTKPTPTNTQCCVCLHCVTPEQQT